MRHAAPVSRQPLNRATQLTLAAISYAVAGLATALITFGSALTIWGLWQWMGVN